MIRRLFSLFSVALIGLSLLPGVAGAQTTEVPGDCVLDENAVLQVLLLIDQSGSLQQTDPDDQRITGARAVVRSYAALADQVRQIEFQVAGFGEDYRPGEWEFLDQDTLGDFLERVETVGSEDDQDHTDYVYALDGASQAFSDSPSVTCQILFWFTDGQHDLDEDLLPAEGLQRFYFAQPVTRENVVEAETLMPALVCDAGGYAEQLGELGVSSQIVLLGDESGVDEASRRVLRGMGGDLSLDCGPGNGSFQSVDDVSRLPFIMACSSQVGATQLPDLAPDANGNLVVNEGVVDAGPVPYQLATEVRLITRGTAGSPPGLASSSLPVVEVADSDSGTNALVARPVAAPFSIEISGVAEVCGFVVAQPAVPVVQGAAPTLYQNEPGEFVVVADGPHGRLDGEALGRIQVTADSGQVGSPDGSGWPVTVPTLPAAESFDLTVGMTSGPGLVDSATQNFTLNEPINAPAIVEQPPPISGEGVGPFLIDLQVDPKDGGELCLVGPQAGMTDANEEVITATADLAGSDCIQVEPGGMQTVTMGVTLERAGFAQGVLEFQTQSTPQTSPERVEEGSLAIDLEVTPKANPVLVALVVAGLMLLMLGLLWAILYGVNRLIARIPDPRRNRVRYANFVAELTPTEYGELEIGIVEAPVDSAFRLPKRTPARLDSGGLRVERIVSVVPWVAPYARIGLGTDWVGAHQGPGLPGRTLVAEKVYRGRARDALGPLVTIGLTNSQMDRLAEGTAQKAPGVLLFDIRTARGADASRVAADMISDSLGLIAAEISTRNLVVEMERTGDS